MMTGSERSIRRECRARYTCAVLAGLVLLGAAAAARPAEAQETDAALIARARAIHDRVLTIDTHDDIPLDFATAAADPGVRGERQVDLPKMEEGGLDAGFFVVYVGQTARTPENEAQAQADAMTKFEAIHRMAEQMYPDRIEIAYTADDFERIAASGKSIAAIGIENGYVIGRDLSLLATYYDLGARYFGLVHNGHNDIADSANPRANLGDALAEHDGVSAFGAEVIAEVNRLGMMIDVSHASKAAMLDALRLSRAPVIASHSSVRALADTPRNLDDEQLLALRDNGGVMQTVALGGFVSSTAAARGDALRTLRADLGLPRFGPVDPAGLDAARSRRVRPPDGGDRPAVAARRRRHLRRPHRLRGRADRSRPRRHQLRLRRGRRRRGVEPRRRDLQRHPRAGAARLYPSPDRPALGRQPAAGAARGRTGRGGQSMNPPDAPRKPEEARTQEPRPRR